MKFNRVIRNASLNVSIETTDQVIKWISDVEGNNHFLQIKLQEIETRRCTINNPTDHLLSLIQLPIEFLNMDFLTSGVQEHLLKFKILL